MIERGARSRIAAARCIAAAAALVVSVAHADASRSVQLEELTSTEVAQRIAAGTTTIIVPVGGTEQNGPYIALGKHNARVRILAQRIATDLGKTLVAPVVAYVPEGAIDPPSVHMRHAGTISIPEPVFEQLLEHAARGFKQHGFRDIVLLGDHGGYQRNLIAVAKRLNRGWSSTPVRAHAIVEYYAAADAAFARFLRERGFAAQEIGQHAGLADTSLTLAVTPELVRIDRLRAANATASAEGVVGDPRRASAELGRPGIDAIVASTVDAVRRALARER